MPVRRRDVAIVGMSCRLPGVARSPTEFWEILRSGRDVVGEVGSDRWNSDYYHHDNRKESGKSYTFSAGLIDGVDAFDAHFFGISPREAAQMDPQQRLLLELAWEALEDAGQIPKGLAGTDCSVFVGISNPDFISSRIEDVSTLDAYSMTGGSLSIAANRISYFLDLCGPSMSIDTACSSSLVALHQACQSIQRGESSAALVGGVNLLLSPFSFIGFSQASMLSPTGRCRAFDAEADGYVRAEGGAVLFLKPLAKAKADGDTVHAVILGTDVNSDGHTHGLSLPNTAAQEALLRAVYEKAGVSPDDLAYLEAHGTGTVAGDPQEAGAIGRAIGMRRNGNGPLLIGSVKTNIGHLEAGAGLAGLIKVVLSLQHRAIPASLHFHSPNPDIPFSELNLQVASEYTPLSKNGSRMVMGVNSFGFGGANAHVILGEFPTPAMRRPIGKSRSSPPLFISARNQAALRELVGAYADRINRAKPADYYDLAYTAAVGRQQHEWRLAIPSPTPAALGGSLREFGETGRAAGVVSGQTVATPARVALLFSGNGSQWPGMGRRMLSESRVFRRAVEEADALLRPLTDFSVVDELKAKPEKSRLHLTEVAQPALFALQVGVLEVLSAKGLEPDVVFGHSVGEITAAYAAGALTFEQAAITINARSAAQAPTRGLGRMAVAALPASEMLSELATADCEVEIAAVNSPRSVTLSGALAGLQTLEARFRARGVFFRILDLEYAFHSRFMEPVRAPLLESISDLTPSATRLPYVSTVTGTILDGEELGAAYWWDNIRQPVLLDRAFQTLASKETYLFVEVGPHPILQGYAQENLSAMGERGRTLATLKKNDDGESRLLEVICTSHVLGAPLNLKKLFPKRGRCVSLPTYAWQREIHRYPSTTELTRLLNPRSGHPLLGFRVPHVEGTWENQIDTVRFPYLCDHVVGGAVVFPASAFIEMALAAAAGCPMTDPCIVTELEIRSPLVLMNGQSKVVRLSLTEDGREFSIRSRPRFSDDKWTLNVVGRLVGSQSLSAQSPAPVCLTTKKRSSSINAEQHYRLAVDVGLCYGPMFRGVTELWPLREGCALARIEPPSSIADLGSYHIHPVLLDACLQTLLGALANQTLPQQPVAYLPQRLSRFHLFGDGATIRYCEVIVKSRLGRSVVADFKLADSSGATVATMEGFRFKCLPLTVDGDTEPSLYQFRAIQKSSDVHIEKSPLPRPETLADHVAPAIEREWRALRRAEYYEQFIPLLDALIADYTFEALQALGATDRAFTIETLVSSGGISGRQAQLLNRLLHILHEEGIGVCREGEWVLPGSIDLPDAASIWRRMLADFPAYVAELTIVGRCGMHLAAVLRGELEAASLLSPVRGVSAAEHLLKLSPTIRVMGTALRAIIREIAQHWPSSRRLRVLEISNGSSTMANELLRLLPKGRCDYVIAASDEEARAHLASEFAEVPQVSTIELGDICNLVEQGSPSDTFDVLIASCIFQGAENVQTVLRNVRRLLSTDGLLLFMGQNRSRITDFVFGIDPAWWNRAGAHDDDVPVGDGSLKSWRASLTASGLVDITSVEEPVFAENPHCCLFVARNPCRPPQPDATTGDLPRHIMLVSDASGDSREVADRLTESLVTLGHQVVNVRVSEGSKKTSADSYEISAQRPQDILKLYASLASGEAACTDLIQLAGYSMCSDLPDTDLMAIQERRCATTIQLAQGILGADWPVTPRLWIVTCRAMAPECSEQEFLRPIPSQAPVWGVGRVLMNEHPEFQCKLVDLHVAEDPVVAARLLVGELRASDNEDEVILTGDRRYVMRAWPTTLDEFKEFDLETQSEADGEFVGLDFTGSGVDRLQWQQRERPILAADEIAIRPHATGLNFRDVMLSMGMLPDEAVENGFAGPNLGMECAGDVVAIGAEVQNFKAGDRVVCFAPSSFGSYVVTKSTAAACMPIEWSYEEAASVPVAFFTAYYGLHHLGELGPEHKVLIHGAAGGVGLAAIQYARHCGAEVFATAGSEEKRDFLRLLGIKHVLNSRNLAFADEVLELTQGKGVDIVLNSLSGEAVSRNLEVLRPFGRLLELGKRDYYENGKVALRPFRNNISYFGIDIDQLFKERPHLAGRTLCEVMELFVAGVFRPLPHCVFPNVRIADAFRHMQQSRHIGKIVVTYDDQPLAVKVPESSNTGISFRSDATYLVAGGLGGFGLATAQWMAANGARNLALLGRTGASSTESQKVVAELEAAGAMVRVVMTDISEGLGLSETIADIESAMPPIRGIVHAAMVLDDDLVQNLDWNGMSLVLRPKVLGAWNLHRQSLGMSLDFFILYSSATTGIGNPGQSSYVAANLFLESLASYRRTGGLPGLAVCWGPIDDVGYLTRNETIKDALTSRLGGPGLSSRTALRTLERLLSTERNGLAIINLDWNKVAHALPAVRSAKFSLLTRGKEQAADDAGQVDDIRVLMKGLSDDQALELTTSILLEQVAKILRMPAKQIDVECSIFDLGMDSLMAVELQVAIGSQFGIEIPAMAMTEDMSIIKLAGQVAKQLVDPGDSDGRIEADSENHILASLISQHGERVYPEGSETLADEVAESCRPIR